MLAGLSGTLLSHYFAERLLSLEYAGSLGESSAPAAFRQFRRWWRERASQLGPASSIRAIREQAVVPLVEILGFCVAGTNVISFEGQRVGLLVGLWTDTLDALWRTTVRAGMAASAPWCLCCNGHQIRLVDAART